MIRLNQFEIFVSSSIHEKTFETVPFQKKTLLRKKRVNRESKILEITIELYRFYEHEARSSCNTTNYLSRHCGYIQSYVKYTKR